MMPIYRMLLRLYPETFRAAFGAEILATLARLDADRAGRGTIPRILLTGREIAGLLAGIFGERFRLDPSVKVVPAMAQTPVSGEIAALEESIRFHLAQTIECIAHHRFEGARFHAREEDLARQRLHTLHGPPPA